MGDECQNSLVSVKWELHTAVGALLILLGAVAVLAPVIASWGVAVTIGWTLVVGALFLFGTALCHREGVRVVTRLLWAAATLIAGLYLLIAPDQGTRTLTLVLVVYFITTGGFRLLVASREQGEPTAGWLAANGVFSLVLGLFILLGFPSSAEWAIGLLVGIDFIFTGWVLLMIATAGKYLNSEAWGGFPGCPVAERAAPPP
jgi:uncharacterized membrane protein HdeD (DUF308 family)